MVCLIHCLQPAHHQNQRGTANTYNNKENIQIYWYKCKQILYENMYKYMRYSIMRGYIVCNHPTTDTNGGHLQQQQGKYRNNFSNKKWAKFVKYMTTIPTCQWETQPERMPSFDRLCRPGWTHTEYAYAHKYQFWSLAFWHLTFIHTICWLCCISHLGRNLSLVGW